MKKLVLEIQSLEQRLLSSELERGESTALMMKLKRLKKRLNKLSIFTDTSVLVDYNTDITNSMFDNS